MRARSLFGFIPFLLGMGIFGWLVFDTPAQGSVSALDKAASLALPAPIWLPWASRDAGGQLLAINEYRRTAGLPALLEAADDSAGAAQHARYMVKTDQLVDREDRLAYPEWYSDEGNLAAQSSLLIISDTVAFTDRQAVDFWLRSPFQALSLLDPELRQTGFGSYREADGGWQMAAALNVRRGWQSGAPAGVAFPVLWPGAGTTIALRTYSGQDYPDPLAAPYCQPGFRGLPVIAQFGDGAHRVRLAAASPTLLTASGGPLPHCAFSETEYPANPNDGNYGQILLDTRDAVVLMPQYPLEPGGTYTVTVNVLVDDVPATHTWSFSVAADAP